MPDKSSSLRQWLSQVAVPVPARLKRNFRPLGGTSRTAVEDSLVANYFVDFPDGYLDTPDGRDDLIDHLDRRSAIMRRRMIPWLDHLLRLDGARILEIGCGTGSATVAFAEQGAKVTALELFPLHMRVAQERARACRVDAEFVQGNAIAIDKLFEGRAFDLVIFVESLEHMTVEERLASLAKAWALIRRGGILAITGAPNRLWFYDHHTSRLPFFMWLPDELAYRYSRISPRPVFRDSFHDPDRANMEAFLRWGRGVSYHEIELALSQDIQSIDVLPSMAAFNHRKNALLWAKWKASADGRFSKLLRQMRPGLPAAFAEPSLNIAIRKT